MPLKNRGTDTSGIGETFKTFIGRAAVLMPGIFWPKGVLGIPILKFLGIVAGDLRLPGGIKLEGR